MKLTNDIIDRTRQFSNLPKERFHMYLEQSTSGFYKNWLKQAEQLIERGEHVITDEEILLLEFYEAYTLFPLQKEIEMIKLIQESNDPDAQNWLQKVSHVVKSTRQDIAELTEKLDNVRPPR